MRLSELPEIDNTLRPYQIIAKRDIYRTWETCRTVLFQMPTGTGKTRLFSSIIRDTQRQSYEEHKRKGVLVLAHRIELIQQIDETLSQKYGIAHGIIKSGGEEEMKLPVQVASVQTIVKRLDRWKQKGFSYIIIDEAHHAVASTYMTICKQFPDAMILGVTATPCRLTGDALKRLFGALIISQPVSKFIEQGYLSPYYYYSIKSDSFTQRELDSINHFNIEGDYAEADMLRVCDTNRVRANIIAAYLKYAKGKKGIIYTINQSHNQHICEEFEKIGVKIKSIDSKTPAEERKQTVAQFKRGAIDIICNVNIFSEGFDCPDCEFIQLARPTCSLAMYLQQVGRGLRPHEKKAQAIILDNVGSYNKFGLPSANRQWRRHFEGLGQRVTQSSAATNGLGGGWLPRKVTEGEEEMVLIYSGVAKSAPELEYLPLLRSILHTREWFPLGNEAMLDPYLDNLLQSFHRIKFYGMSDDVKSWGDEVESIMDGLAEQVQNLNRQEEVNWVIQRIKNTFRFYHEGKYGLACLRNTEDTLSEDIELYKEGKKSFDEIVTILLMPVYDEIGIGDNRDFSICKKNGQYGVIAGETMTTQIPFIYDEIEFQVSGVYFVRKFGRYGIINDSGEVLVPIEYEQITESISGANEFFYFAFKNNRYEAFLKKGESFEILPKEIPILKGLADGYFIGRLSRSYGAICNSKGLVLFPYPFDVFGVLNKDDRTAKFFVQQKGFYTLLDHELNPISNLKGQKLKKIADFFNTFNLERIYSITPTGLRDWKDIQKRIEAADTAIKNTPEKAQQHEQTNNAEHVKNEETEPVEIERPIEHGNNTASIQLKPVLPPGVFENNEGLQGYAINGKVVVEPIYEQIMPYGKERLIVRKNSKDGLLSITDGIAHELVPCIFKGLSGTNKHRYSIQMFGGYSEAHTEDFLKNVILQTEQHLLVKTTHNTVEIRYQSRKIAEYMEVIHLGGEVFAAQNKDGYGLIRCGTLKVIIIRPFEYAKIELSQDKRNILLYKTGRPRFIPLIQVL